MSFEMFNVLLRDFLDELRLQFPDNADIGVMRSGLPALITLDNRKPARIFVSALLPHAALVASKDPALFDALTIGDIDFAALWHATTDQATRGAVFEHVHSLFVLGSHLLSSPGV